MSRISHHAFDPIVESRWLEGYSPGEWVGSVQCPTLLLQADESCGGMLNDSDAEMMQREIDECLLVRFEGVGHLIHWMATEKTMRVVNGFLESL